MPPCFRPLPAILRNRCAWHWGALLIQKRKKLSDRTVVAEIAENPYQQYFIGMEQFIKEYPFRATSLVAFSKRLDAEFLMVANGRTKL